MRYRTAIIDGREYRIKLCPPGSAIHGKPNLNVEEKMLRKRLLIGEITHKQFRKRTPFGVAALPPDRSRKAVIRENTMPARERSK